MNAVRLYLNNLLTLGYVRNQGNKGIFPSLAQRDG